ncbi:MAG: sulfotransferase family protein [Chitinophagales bacterium]
MQNIKHTFICIGAQKAGTTTLSDILSQHSDIYIPPIKETKFFLFDEDYAKGLTFYNETYFNTYKGQKAVGEFDPDYLLFPGTARRIADTLGTDLKIMVVLRNPADRAYSHYLMTKKKGLEPLSFLEAIEHETKRKGDKKQQKIYAYLERGYYGAQLQEFMSIFPKENFLILLFDEDIIRNRESTIESIQQFLGVHYEKLNYDLHSNEAGESKSETVTNLVRKPNFVKKFFKNVIPTAGFRKKIRKYLIRKNQKAVATAKLDVDVKKEIIQKYFIKDIQLTEQLTGKNLSGWL